MNEVFNELLWAVVCKKCDGLTQTADGTLGLFVTEETAKQRAVESLDPEHPAEIVRVHVIVTKEASA